MAPTRRSPWTARGARVACACALVAGLGVLPARALPRPVARAAQTECASLGQAANFAVFSGGAFDSSQPSGTSISGRIAAAGNVTLDGVSVNPAAGDPSPTVIAAGNFTAGRTTGNGGSLNGGIRVQGTIDIAPNFSVGGTQEQGAPGFSFADEFTQLRTVSSSLADLSQSPGATVGLDPNSRALNLTGTGAGTNVFTVSAADLASAAGVVISLTQAGATALINVTTDTDLAIGPQYMNLTGTAAPARIAWNFPLATGLAVTHGVAWQGLILAPNASVTGLNHPQLAGQMIARTVPDSNWVINRTAFTGCLPVPIVPPDPTPDDTLSLKALCLDSAGRLDMRLTNTGAQTRHVTWKDLTGRDFGAFDIAPDQDFFFEVRDGSATSVIQATAGATTITERGTGHECAGSITVQMVAVGPAPAGARWPVRIDDGTNGAFSQVVTLAAGESQTVAVPGGYEPGAAPIGQVVGGTAYTVTEEDTLGADTTVVSLNPVMILDGQEEVDVVTNTYIEDGGTSGGGDGGTPVPPTQPTLPPGAPNPRPGPDLTVAGRQESSAPDLVVTHRVTPARVGVGDTVRSVTTVRNRGRSAAAGVVMREIPQLRPDDADSVAHVLDLTTTAGICTRRRPVRCVIGTMAPGASVTVRTRTRVLVDARLRSIVLATATTPETNTANNMAIARVRSTDPRAGIRAGVRAPATGRVGTRLRYRVSVTGAGSNGARSVRLCTRPPRALGRVSAPGTFSAGGRRCRDFDRVRPGETVSFVVSGEPRRTGRVIAPARATAVGVARASRAFAPVAISGPSPTLTG
jgi:choice-of-anchor A domain-containing protein